MVCQANSFCPHEGYSLGTGDRMMLRCHGASIQRCPGGNSERNQGWRRFQSHFPNCPELTFQRASRPGETIRSFLEGPHFNPAFLTIHSQSHYRTLFPSAEPCSKVSVAEASPLEISTCPNGQRLCPLDYLLAGHLMIAIIGVGTHALNRAKQRHKPQNLSQVESSQVYCDVGEVVLQPCPIFTPKQPSFYCTFCFLNFCRIPNVLVGPHSPPS